MFAKIKKLFTPAPPVNYAELVRNGAVILDVRSKAEYQSGHIKGSVNIPLDTLTANIKKVDKSKTIVTCCASGMRSASARSILQSNGYTNVYNGGGWSSLKGKLTR